MVEGSGTEWLKLFRRGSGNEKICTAMKTDSVGIWICAAKSNATTPHLTANNLTTSSMGNALQTRYYRLRMFDS